MKYKVIVCEGVNSSSRNGITVATFYTYSQADAFCRSVSNTDYGGAPFICYLWTGTDTVTYENGSPA